MSDLIAMENAYFSAEPERSWDKRCEGIANAGFDGVYVVPYPLDQSALDGYLRHLSKVETRHGIKVSAVYANIDLANPRDDHAANGPLNILKLTESIPRLELSFKCSKPDTLPADLQGEIVSRLEALLELADEKDTDIALYHHSFYPLETPDEVRKILNRMDHPRLKMLFATSHAFAIWNTETVASQLKLHASSIASFNICGCKRVGDLPSKTRHFPPQESDLELRPLLSLLDQADYKGDLIVQGQGWQGNIDRLLRQTVDWFNRDESSPDPRFSFT